MSLLSRLREKQASRNATATPATFATQVGGETRTVASVATVAVAKSPLGRSVSTANDGAGDTTTVSQWWLIHYLDRDPVEVACCPAATHAEILVHYPDAVAAEPYTPATRQPSAPLSASEEVPIRAWLVLIEENDPSTIAAVISQCQQDAHSRDYFTRRAVEEL